MTSERAPHPEALSYARHWEPLLAGPAQRALARLDGEPAVFLDVGAGTGGLMSVAAARWPTARIIALDATAGMLSLGRLRLSRERPSDRGRLEWLAADALAMPLADASVDPALSSFVLGVVDSRVALLTEVRRVLRPGGAFSTVTWLADELVVGADAVLDELVRDVRPTDPSAPLCLPRASDYRAADELAGELAAAGFSDIRCFEDELRHTWSREQYLEFKQRFDERDLFESLGGAEREELLARLRRRWAALPDAAFEMHAPLVAATARRPSGQGRRPIRRGPPADYAANGVPSSGRHTLQGR